MSTKDVVIVSDVKKSFKVNHGNTSSLKASILGLFGKKNQKMSTEQYEVLRGVSFNVQEGEFFGIVGRNGSGKSTLLKIIAQIYQPTAGSVNIKGKLVPFIELGVGFNPELTGRENVFLNGALLGFSRKEMEEKYDDIVEFAELGRFMDQKLKNYSSGMQVRLAFSVAIRADADVLLIDEVLAVGDEAFQRKCLNYFAELKKKKKTVIFVTHSMDAVQQFCDRALLIDSGKVEIEGSSSKVAQAYRELFFPLKSNTKPNEAISINNAIVKAKYKKDKKLNKLCFKFDVNPKFSLKSPAIIMKINRDTGEQVYRWASDEKIKEPYEIVKDQKFTVSIEIDNIFPNGKFDVQFAIVERNRTKDYVLMNDIINFEIVNDTPYSGDVYWKPKETYLIS